ncbi:hypothetical protein JW935_17225 [candidate division KSB1 bacterium]|nr:hypothetical protein [candidate division KSB1 bacterium]
MNKTHLKDDWLIESLNQVGWDTDGQKKQLFLLDQTENHRLVSVFFITHNERKRKAVILHGIDYGIEFWIRVVTTLHDVKSAIQWLKPRPVLFAEKNKIPVLRQGDWFFIKMLRFSPGEIFKDVAYGNHIIEFWSKGNAKGIVRHGQHDFLFLDGWHKPVRCRGWHTLSYPKKLHNQKYWKDRILNKNKDKRT